MNWYGVITNAGKSLLAHQDEDNPFIITSATAGTGKVAEAALLAQTALAEEKQTISIIQKKVENDSKIIMLRITSVNLTEGYTCNQIGLWAKIGGELPVLFALYQNDEGQDIPAHDNSPEFVWTFNAAIEVNNEAEINITVDTQALVTQEELEEVAMAADDAQSTADAAKLAANRAQTTANTAKTAADDAQGTADEAVTAIEELETNIEQKYAVKEEISDFVSKSNSGDIFGNGDNMNGSTYLPGLVPSGNSGYTADMYLKGNGVWSSPFGVVSGKLTNCSSSTSYSITCPSTVYGKGYRYLEIFGADGTLLYAGSISTSATSVTNVFTRNIANATTCTTSSINIFFGNTNAGTTLYWRCLCY